MVKIAYLALGLGLLAVVLVNVDVAEALAMTAGVGWGFALVVLIYFVEFLADCLTWQIALVRVPLNATWLYRAWKVRMVGEVFNAVIPAAGVGGEPLKAELLKRHYGVDYRDGAASIILAKTVNMIALVLFLACGLVLTVIAPGLPDTFDVLAAAGMAVLVAATGVFYAAQRFALSSRLGAWLSARPMGRPLTGALASIADTDARLIRFYVGHRGRFALAVGLGLVNWILGVLEVYVTMRFLGHPVSVADAWIIEAGAQLFLVGVFFVPAGIGVQEGAFVVICAALTGSPALGVAAALVRRVREVLWLIWGTAIGGAFALKRKAARN